LGALEDRGDKGELKWYFSPIAKSEPTRFFLKTTPTSLDMKDTIFCRRTGLTASPIVRRYPILLAFDVGEESDDE